MLFIIARELFMAMAKLLPIEVFYAKDSEEQYSIPLLVPEQTTVASALELSGILTLCHEIDLASQKVGIFSKLVTLEQLVKKGDRIEIYRPLLIDPKQAR